MIDAKDAMTVVAYDNDLVAQERAALATAWLITRGELSLADAQSLTGLSYGGVWYLMGKITRVVACWYDKQAQAWKIMENTTDDGNGR